MRDRKRMSSEPVVDQCPEDSGGRTKKRKKTEGKGARRSGKSAKAGESVLDSDAAAKMLSQDESLQDPGSPPEAILSVKRLEKSVGMGLPSNRVRTFLGSGTIPPVSETKNFVARLKNVDRVEITVLEGDEDQADRCEFVGEIGLANIQLREDKKAELEVTFNLDRHGILTVSLIDRNGNNESTARFMLPQFRRELKTEIDLSDVPVDELSKKIDLLEQQMDLLKGELTVRRERK